MGNYNRLLSGDITPVQRHELIAGAGAEEWADFERAHRELRDLFESPSIEDLLQEKAE
jgi:hypothetical protein